jgi:PAS domain S-box-containing protein
VLERELAELAASEARHRQIVELVREGIGVTDVEGRWTYANRRLEEMLGYGPGEMLGQPVVDVMDADGRTRNEARAQDRRRGISGSGETRIVRRDGKEIWVKFDSIPVVSESGGYSGSLTVVFDITERRTIEDQLRRSEEQLLEAQALAHIGTGEWDLRTNQVTCSAELCRILDVSEGELGSATGLVHYERIHPEDRARIRAEIQEGIARRMPFTFTYRLLRADGICFLHAWTRVICDESGAPIRAVATIQDVTERKQVEARLLLADRMVSIGTLAAGVAHEINNPLTYIVSNLELAAEAVEEMSGGGPSPQFDQLAAMVAEARQGGERVRKIVRGLKTFSRADEERRAVLDVREVLEVAASMANNEIVHRARLVKDYGETPAVFADEARLGQVFINLLVNAAQALPDGRAETHEICISTRSDEAGRAVIEVRDTGRGMSPEVRVRVFDPFFTTKPIGVGTGLGLSICHGIIAALGGEITVESEVGKGTVFRVALPAASAVAAPPDAKPTDAALPAAQGRILVVDDDARVGKTLSRTLRGHEVTVLTDAREAAARVAAGERFDLVFCDLMIPEMTGMDLHAELARTNPDLASRMVFVTGGAFTEAAMEFLDRVPNERIDKPFDAESLRTLVQRLLLAARA